MSVIELVNVIQRYVMVGEAVIAQISTRTFNNLVQTPVGCRPVTLKNPVYVLDKCGHGRLYCGNAFDYDTLALNGKESFGRIVSAASGLDSRALIQSHSLELKNSV